MVLSSKLQIRSAGYGVAELNGFDDELIDLYNHLPILNVNGGVEKEIGGVVVQYHVGHKRNLVEHELDHLRRKATQNAWFAWPPGEECLSREFVPMRTDRQGVLQKGETSMGCKPCRDRASDPEELPLLSDEFVREELSSIQPINEPTVAASEPSLPPPAALLLCPDCDDFNPTVPGLDRQKRALKRHMTSEHGITKRHPKRKKKE